VFSSIVVGTDGSESAREALRQAIALAARDGARLDIVSAYESVPAAQSRERMSPAPEEAEWMLARREEVDAVLREAQSEAEAAGLTAVTRAAQGDPADAILDVAEEQHADLVVVGNRGLAGAKRFLLGSVPNRVSHHAPCSVLIVRSG
jgi:nucleotide-binding universal stress UspA family protein